MDYLKQQVELLDRDFARWKDFVFDGSQRYLADKSLVYQVDCQDPVRGVYLEDEDSGWLKGGKSDLVAYLLATWQSVFLFDRQQIINRLPEFHQAYPRISRRGKSVLLIPITGFNACVDSFKMGRAWQ